MLLLWCSWGCCGTHWCPAVCMKSAGLAESKKRVLHVCSPCMNQPHKRLYHCKVLLYCCHAVAAEQRPQ